MKRIRFTIRFLGALIAKHYLAVGLGIALSLFLFNGLPSLLVHLPKIRSTWTIGVVGRFTQSDIPLSVQNKISIGLTTLSQDNLPHPGLAKSWDISEDGKTYTFIIDKSLTWHDGKAVVSSDIKYNFRDVSIDYPDPEKIIFKLKEPFSPLLSAVSRPVFSKGLIGVGPYKLKKIKKASQFIDNLFLEPTDKNSNLPNLKYVFSVSESQATLGFKLGLIKAIEEVADISQLAKWPNVKIVSNVRHDRYLVLFFNTQQVSKLVRQALSYAVNKSQWENKANGPINPKSWYYNPETKKYDYDLEKAGQLFKRADKNKDAITISVPPQYEAVALNIKKDWEKLGIVVNIAVSANPLESDYDAVLLQQQIPTDPDQYNLWHSNQQANISKLKNDRIDLLLEKGRKATSAEERKSIYLDFQRFIMEESPAIFLFHPINHTLTKN